MRMRMGLTVHFPHHRVKRVERAKSHSIRFTWHDEGQEANRKEGKIEFDHCNCGMGVNLCPNVTFEVTFISVEESFTLHTCKYRKQVYLTLCHLIGSC